MFDLTGFRLMRRVAHGRSRSLACHEHHRRRLRKRNKGHHCIRTSAMTRCVFRRIIFFHELGRPFFFCFVSFLFFFLFFAFFFLEHDFAQFAIRGYAPAVLKENDRAHASKKLNVFKKLNRTSIHSVSTQTVVPERRDSKWS